jgi:hypothetical protein
MVSSSSRDWMDERLCCVFMCINISYIVLAMLSHSFIPNPIAHKVCD